MNTVRRIPAGLALMLLATACAQERDPINRVQANVMPKSFFVGEDLKDIADDPEFYMRGTVIDVGYGAAQDGLFTSTYAQPVSRVRWEITESFLNARLAYERIEGTDGHGEKLDGLRKKTTNDGQIVASYRIASHFDVAPAYNPVTGEELNVVEENTSDRPWYERAYLRVDWSINHATSAYDFDTLAMIGIYGGVQYEPLAFTVQDPNDENAPLVDLDNGYMDVTNKAFATPQLIDLSSLGWGMDKFPACMLPGEFAGGTAPAGNCNPVEITIRQSFKRVRDTDYEPVNYDGTRFMAYGIFNFSYRYGYERNYGMVDDKWFRFAARYNIWERSHYYDDSAAMTGPVACATRETTEDPTGNPNADPNRDDNNEGTADECEAVTGRTSYPGSQCDVFKARCTLPVRARQPRTIPWYIGGKTDPDLFEATNWATLEWDLSMKAAVQVARLVECRRTRDGDCNAQYPMWTGQQEDFDEAVRISRELDACRRANGYSNRTCLDEVDRLVADLADERGDANDANARAIGEVIKLQPMFVLCHNPVTASDHPACGVPGLSPRLGDLRYNTVLIIDKPQSPSSWGIMVDADDPVTGEKVAASINIWDHVTDLAVQGLVDLVRYANGELSTDEITNGDYVRDWASAVRLAAGGQGGPTLEARDVDERLAAATKLDGQAFAELTRGGLSAELKAQLRPTYNQALDVAVRAGTPSMQQTVAQSRMAMARGTRVETELLNPAIQQVSGVPGDLPVDGPLADLSSPLRLNNPQLLSRLRQARENALAARGACILNEAPEPSGITGLADILNKKFPAVAGESSSAQRERYEKMHRYLKRRFQYSVIIHEMGHSVGHRHNFVSSSAPLFYRPQYWQLRTKNGHVTRECTDAVSDGSSCVGPRYFDPLTDEEQSQLISMYMHSSVMDYPGDLAQDTMGLGVWDVAATRMFYGDNTAVYANTGRYGAGTPAGVGLTNATDTFGGLVGIKYSLGGSVTSGPEEFHYAQLQNAYGLIEGCHEVVPTAPPSWDADTDGEWDPALDGHLVAVDGSFSKCKQPAVDYVAWNDLRMPSSREIGGGYYRGGPSVDSQSRLRVPYAFATDNWADLGNASVYRHDNGADPYEIAQFLITTQENRHILDNFRRNRTTFDVRAARDRGYSRYNEKLLGLASAIGFFSNIYKNFAASQGYTFDTLWPYIVDWQVRDNMIAASLVFDHFVRQLARPEDGEHFALGSAYGDEVLRSAKDPEGNARVTNVIVPNGTTGYLRDIGFGGHPLENALSEDNGDFDTDYTMNAGSYYEKINVAILLSESEDRFISQSRGDFYDARGRAAGMADVFPDGWRRVLANSLTADRSLMAPQLAADSQGNPLLDVAADTRADPLARSYPARPIGWTSWWPRSGPVTCFPSMGRNVCAPYRGYAGDFAPELPANTVGVDPQIGWEVQKFLIAWTLAYIPANQRTNWIDLMRIYRLGENTPQDFEQRIEWQDPVSGQTYYALSVGTECLFGTGASCQGGRIVEKGIAARILEYANELTARGFALDTAGYPATGKHPAGFNAYGRAMVLHHPDGNPVVTPDPGLVEITASGGLGTPPPACNQNEDPTCTQLTIFDNHWAYELSGYKSVPDYLWEVLRAYQLATPDQLGLYP